MLKQLINTQMYYSPDSVGGDVLNPAGKDDLYNLLKDDEPEIIDLTEPKLDDKDDKDEKVIEDKKDKKQDKKDDKDDEEKDEDDKDDDKDELEQLEDELKEPTEEQLELRNPARRAVILKAYPKLFKDFPELESAYYRDQKFTEVFPTIKEAEAAAESVTAYNELNAKIKTGDIESVITDISKDNKAFARMVDNYLPTLSKINPDAYHHIVGNLIKYTVQEMVSNAKDSGNESLKTAAAVLHQFIFGNTKWTPPTNLSTESVDPKTKEGETELEKREREFNLRRFTTAQGDIAGRVDNAIKATIAQHMDPKNVMTDYVRNTAIGKALDQVGDLINRDTRFKSLLDRLWQNAAKSDFSKSELDKIKGACVSKARTLLPSVIKTARNEALKGMGKRVVEEKDEEVEITQPEKKGNSAPQSRGQKVDKSKPLPGESSADFLLRD